MSAPNAARRQADHTVVCRCCDGATVRPVWKEREQAWGCPTCRCAGRYFDAPNDVPNAADVSDAIDRYGAACMVHGKPSPRATEARAALDAALLAQRAADAVPLWECPDCAFRMDAAHVDETTGTHSCPSCAEARLAKELAAMRPVFVAAMQFWACDSMDEGGDEADDARIKLREACISSCARSSQAALVPAAMEAT